MPPIDLLEASEWANDPLIDMAAEGAVLGAVLLDPTTYFEVAPVIDPADFGHPHHGFVWAAMEAVSARGEVIEMVSLCAELRAQGRLNTVGGAQFVSALADSVGTTAYIDQHAEIVAERARQRVARDKLAKLAMRARDVRVSSAETEAESSAALLNLCGVQRVTTVYTAQQMMAAMLEDLDRPVDEAPGIATPFTGLTRVLGGWGEDQLIVIAARPATGKTAFVIECARAAAAGDVGVLFCSLETGKLPLGRRLTAAYARVPLDAVSRRRPATVNESRKIYQAADELSKLPLWTDINPHQSVASIRSRAHSLHAQRKLGLIIVDYLQLMKGSRRNDSNREQEVSEMSRELKVLANTLHVPVIALAQLNREVEKQNREPRMSDLRESGAIEQNADVILFLHREGEQNAQEATETIKVLVAKQRDGLAGMPIPLTYCKAETRFYETDFSHKRVVDGFVPDPPHSYYDTDGDAEFGAPLGDAE